MALDIVLKAIVTICILVFSAKVLGEIFSWRKIPSVLGELFAGIVLGPFALGSLIVVNGTPLIEINEIVLAFGEIGGILILFVAGLEITFRDFRKVGMAGFVVDSRRGCALSDGVWAFIGSWIKRDNQSSGWCRTRRYQYFDYSYSIGRNEST